MGARAVGIGGRNRADSFSDSSIRGGGGSSHGSSEKSPETKANEQIRYANTLHQEQERRAQIADRLKWRDKQLTRGVPDTALKPASAIKNGINDNEWASHMQSVQRFFPVQAKATGTATAGAKPASEEVRVPNAKSVAGYDIYRRDANSGVPAGEGDLSGRTAFAGFQEPKVDGAGVTALTDVTNPTTGETESRRVAVTPNAEQAMSLATGGKWDNMTTQERTKHLQDITGQTDRPDKYSLPVGERGTLTVGKDGSRRIDSPYGTIVPATPSAAQPAVQQHDVAPAPSTPTISPVAPVTPVAAQPGLLDRVVNGVSSAVRDAQATPIPDLGPGAAEYTPNAATRAVDSVISKGIEVGKNALSSLKNVFTPTSEGVAYGQQQGPGAAESTPNDATKAVDAAIAPVTGDIASAAKSVGSDIASGAKSVVNKVESVGSNALNSLVSVAATDPSRSEGRATSAGVSNATASQFEQPTQDSPLPTTPTTPDENIDKTKQSVAADEEWKNNRDSFDGF